MYLLSRLWWYKTGMIVIEQQAIQDSKYLSRLSKRIKLFTHWEVILKIYYKLQLPKYEVLSGL